MWAIILTCSPACSHWSRGRITKDADQHSQVERHIEDAFGSRHTTTKHGGRKTGEPGEKPSKHGRDQLQQLYSHEFRQIENQHGLLLH